VGDKDRRGVATGMGGPGTRRLQPGRRPRGVLGPPPSGRGGRDAPTPAVPHGQCGTHGDSQNIAQYVPQAGLGYLRS